MPTWLYLEPNLNSKTQDPTHITVFNNAKEDLLCKIRCKYQVAKQFDPNFVNRKKE